MIGRSFYRIVLGSEVDLVKFRGLELVEVLEAAGEKAFESVVEVLSLTMALSSTFHSGRTSREACLVVVVFAVVLAESHLLLLPL